MLHQTGILFSIQFPSALYVFVFAGSACSYNFHWFLTPPHSEAESYKLRWNISNKRVHLVLFLASGLLAALSAFLLIEHWLWLAITAFLTFMYSAPKIEAPVFSWLRKIAIGKTIFLALAWTHVTVIMPLLLSEPQLQNHHLWFIVNRFFFIYAICIVFDTRDVEKDRKAGIKSLITFLSSKGIDRLFWLSIALVFASLLFLFPVFSWIELIILAVPVLLMALLYDTSKQSNSDYLYYFLLDGLMSLSAPLLILAKFARII